MKLTYNGVVLKEDKSTTFGYVEEASYDDQGAYDGTVIRFAVRTAFATMSAPTLLAGVIEDGSSPTQIMNAVRAALTQNGRKLKLEDEAGTELINSPMDGMDYDEAYGPIVERAEITEFSENAFVVDFAVRTKISVCGQYAPTILRNSWDISVSYDEDWFATHTVTGQMKLSTRLASTNPADYVPNLTPELMPGFVREGFQIAFTRDKRFINYTYVDRQVDTAPPRPATTYDWDYTEGFNGGITYADFGIRLSGPPGTVRGDLIVQAIRIAVAYITGNVDDKEIPDGTILQCALTVSGPRPRISLKIRWRKLNQDQGLGANGPLDPLGIRGTEILRKLEMPAGGRDPGPFAYFIVQTALAAAQQTMCSEDANRASPVGTIAVPQPGETGAIVSTYEVDQLQEYRKDTNFKDAEYGSNPHTEVSTEVQYSGVENKFAFAPAGGGDDELAIIQGAAPVWHKIIKWEATRQGANPVVPNPQTDDPDEVLVGCYPVLNASQMMDDARGELRRQAGVYVYAVRRPPTEYRGAKLPTVGASIQKTSLVSSDFATIGELT